MGKSKKLLDKITNTLGLYEEEEIDAEEEEVEEEEPKPASASKAVAPRPNRFAKAVEEKKAAKALEPEAPKKKSLFSRKKSNKGDGKTINMPLSKKQIKVVVIEPTDFNDSQKIADYLRNNQPVVVNFETTNNATKKRMTDFIYGTIYALSGSIKQIGNSILVCAPKNVDVDANAAMYTDKGGSKWKK
jgi:cell division inhibitor SepF